MKHIIDISAKLTTERPVIRVAEGKEYEVDNSKNKVLRVNQIMNESEGSEVELIDKAIRLLLGERAFEEIEEMKLSFPDYKTIFIAVMAAVSDEEFETVEARFQKA
jgi:hypothetical protein